MIDIAEYEKDFKGLRDTWTKEAYDNYTKHTGKQIVSTPHDNEVDAYRHAYVSAKLTQWLWDNQWAAEIVLDGHEVKAPNKPLEHRMDGWNNEVGRIFGDEYSADELGKKLADELKDGGLLAKTPSDPRLAELYSDDQKLKDGTEGVTSEDMEELGMLGVGSIKIKSERIKPHVGIITNIHDSHLSFHGDESSIAHTKSGLLDGLVPGGVAILPRDSAWYDFLKIKASRVGVNRIITFGKHPEADFRLVKTAVQCGNNIIHACLLGKPVTFQQGASGDHWGLNAMAILAAVYAAEADVGAAVNAMAAIKPSFRRGEVHRVNTDTKRYTIIDDTWNASPASVVAALKNMATMEVAKCARRVFFIGDMLQLGKNETKKHIELVDAIVANGIDRVFTVGELSRSLFQTLPLALRGHHFPDATAASINAKEFVGNGDVILVKGSNAMEMWRVVRALREISSSDELAETPPARTQREGAAAI